MQDDNVYPIDQIRRYRVAMNRRQIASHLFKVGTFLIEVSTIAAVVGRGIKFISRELDVDAEPRRIRFPTD